MAQILSRGRMDVVCFHLGDPVCHELKCATDIDAAKHQKQIYQKLYISTNVPRTASEHDNDGAAWTFNGNGFYCNASEMGLCPGRVAI